jgi:rhodanese-related sulfurtransferase
VRTATEYAVSHQPGAVHAPGGQLVQGTDQWVAARGARLVLIDSELVRAPMTARWLRCMGHDVYVLEPGAELRERPKAASLEHLPTVAALDPHTLGPGVLPLVIDIRASADFATAHLPGAVWSTRCELRSLASSPELPGGLPNDVVLAAHSESEARLAAAELADIGVNVQGWLVDMDACAKAGIALVHDEPVPDGRRIDFLFFVHDRHHGNLTAAQQYLDWETGLVGQLDDAEKALFRLQPH